MKCIMLSWTILKVDVVIKTAAVADYRPKDSYDHKIKKQPGD